MGWSEYARSKVPLKLVFIVMAAVLVNFLIVQCFVLALQFRYEEPIDLALLTEMNEEYENCTLVDTAVYSAKEHSLWGMDYTAYLLENEKGDIKVAVIAKHLLFDRYRYLEKFSGDIPKQEGINAVSLGTNYHQAVFWLSDSVSIGEFHIGQNYGPNSSLIIIPLIIVEYIAYCLLFKREELML